MCSHGFPRAVGLQIEAHWLSGAWWFSRSGGGVGVLARTEFQMMLPMVAATEPAHVERRGVIVMMGLNKAVTAANFTRLRNEVSVASRGLNNLRRAPTFWAISL